MAVAHTGRNRTHIWKKRARAGGTVTAVSLICLSAGADMIDTSGMQPWEVCGLCHGLDGVSRMEKFPILAGQRAGYIEKQFMDFKLGKRTNDGGQMQTITTEVDPSSLPAIADYFSRQPLPSLNGSAKDETLFATGRRLFESGNKKLAACGGCHGAPGNTDAPNLFGQHRDYLEKQLRDFSSGARDNDNSNTMATQARALTDDDIEALAYFLNQARADLPNPVRAYLPNTERAYLPNPERPLPAAAIESHQEQPREPLHGL